MNRESYDILCLPTELLLFVVELLPGKDVISFSLSCKLFSVICRRLRSLYLENYWNNGISVENVKIFLSQSVDPTLITEFNVNNCFWLPAVMLQNFIKKCINIEVLHISETKINFGHLVVIFSKCKNIKDLSFTLCQHDMKITQKDIQHFNITSDDSYGAVNLLCFKDCHENLKKLVKLEIVLFSALQEMTVFLSFCDSLKELVLIPIITTEDQDPNVNWWDNVSSNQATMKGKFVLNSFILVNLHPNIDVVHTYHAQQEVLEFTTNMSELTHYWNNTYPCPVIKNNFSSLTYKHFERPSGLFQELQFHRMYNRLLHQNAGDHDVANRWYLTDPLEKIELGNLKSVREDIPVFISKRLKASQAKLISCFFSNEGFLEFAQNHPRLKVLKLRSPPVRDGVNTSVGDEWYTNSWGSLSELESLSVEPTLLAITEPKYERTNRKRRFHETRDLQSSKSDTPLRAFPILEVIRNCTLIAELEISNFKECDTTAKSVCRVDGEDLSHIAQCKLLKRLTLGNFFITDGIFLEEIIKSCTHLESLRLKSLGSPLLCCFTKNLCASLPSAKKLTTLSLFQRNMVPLGKLLDTLEQCPSLIRLGLVSPSETPPFKWTVDQLARRLLQFCTKLPHLVAFFCVMNIPKSHSAKVTKGLQQTMSLQTPAFCSDIQASSKDRIEHGSSTLPRVHHEVLVNFQSRVGIVPYDYKCSLL